MAYYRHVEIGASMTKCSIQAGKAVLQFEVNGDSLFNLPTLALLTGEKVDLSISSRQGQLLIADTGEVADEGQMEIETPEKAAGETAEEVADAPGQPLEEQPEPWDEGDDWDEYFGGDAA